MNATRRLAWLETRFLGEIRSDDSMLGAFDLHSIRCLNDSIETRTRYASCPENPSFRSRGIGEFDQSQRFQFALIRKARRVATPFAGEQIGERSTNVHGSLEYRASHVRNDLWLKSTRVVQSFLSRLADALTSHAVYCRFTAVVRVRGSNASASKR